jgi:hypothetical protein
MREPWRMVVQRLPYIAHKKWEAEQQIARTYGQQDKVEEKLSCVVQTVQ